ncbi:MAG TPA: 50S ribosomal protein L6 [Candidatus Norongarragalinales archaeon]|jgi:large subunit ribosomal protein L6|nr:50S ribosomal protein L6 [Candidatus Norongarragalinales archaeon]
MAKASIIEINVPSGVTVEVNNNLITVKGGKGSVSHTFQPRTVKIKIADGKATLTTGEKENRNVRALLGSTEAHIKNMVKGVQEPFAKKLTTVYAHFPISIEAKGTEVHIKNFLGEKLPRTAHIVTGAKVEVKGTDVIVTGVDKEAVGQTTSNIVKATYIKQKDRRIFQDGIYPSE